VQISQQAIEVASVTVLNNARISQQAVEVATLPSAARFVHVSQQTVEVASIAVTIIAAGHSQIVIIG
jgi:hypothetical protein